MLRKVILCLLIGAHGILLFTDVFAREQDPNPEQSTVVRGSLVRAALKDIRTWFVAPVEMRLEELMPMPQETPAGQATTQVLVETTPGIPTFKYSELVLRSAENHGVDWRLVASVIAVESSFNPKALSPKGARGLMQLMPGTAALYHVRSEELYDPGKNIDAGVQHLKMLNTRYSGQLEKVIAAYNSGEANVDKYNGVPPFKPTKAFVKRVMTRYQNHLAMHPPISGEGESTTSLAPVAAY